MNKITLFLLFFSMNNCFAQLSDSLINERLYNEVKQLDEFIERFNYKQDIHGNKISPNFSIPRVQYIASLIEANYILRASKASLATYRNFIDTIANPSHPFLIKFAEKDWYAQASCQIIYKNQIKDLDLLLKIEQAPNKTTRWVIIGVKSDFLPLPSRSDDSSLYITPNSHETNFIDMRKNLEKKEQVAHYTQKDFQLDAFSIFLFEIYNGNLKIDFVKKITYHFLQLDNWFFTVDYFDRNISNSVWLISKIGRLNITKEQYIKQLLK